MKNLLALSLSALLLLGLTACGKSETASSESEPASVSTTFVKPKNYATVLSVTINPQFRLYLDAEGKVLAVEAVNEDAKEIIDKIDFENIGYEEVIENIITASNEGGFVKENADIKLEIVETAETIAETDTGSSNSASADSADNNEEEVTERKNEILTKAEEAANNIATELNITITVSAVGKTEAPVTEETPAVSSETKPVHTHSFAAATCLQPAKCACGATEGKALGHSYENGICKRCSAKDPDYLTPCTQKNGIWQLATVSGDKITVIKLKINGKDCDLLYREGAKYNPSINSDADEADCETINGVKYYYGAGDGDGFVFAESGKTVKLSGFGTSDDMAVTLNRTGENTLKVTVADNVPEWLSVIKVGAVFDFIAE